MIGLVIALVGVSGTLLGIFAKALIDRHDEENRRAQREAREDVVWRRQHALDAAAVYLTAVGNVQWQGRNIETVKQQITAAQAAGQIAEMQQLRTTLLGQQTAKIDHVIRANDALSRLSLLLRHETYVALSDHFRLAMTAPLDPALPVAGATVDALLRDDLGLPPREVSAAESLSEADALAKIAEIRAEAGADQSRPSGTASDRR